jgi:sulfhydrogenase subunit beta (sulfur reductase)
MSDAFVIGKERLQDLIDSLAARGYRVIGPVLERGAIVYGPVTNALELPVGFVDEQAGGHYRLRRSAEGGPQDRALFRYAVGPHSWKRFLFPPRHRLWRAERAGDGFSIEAEESEPEKYAFLGVRPCELAAMGIQDRVFDNGEFADRLYGARRESTFVVAVNCTHAGGTCFCASMGTGPSAGQGFDLCLTELVDESAHRFLVEAGSSRGEEILAEVPHRPAERDEIETAAGLIDDATDAMGRHMHPDAAGILKRNPEHPRWLEVASRCLSCANCTLVCPTCFCSTVEDVTSLDGSEAERWRRWDSCFTVDFSYIHGGPIRRDRAARYRQWITHKLAYWHDQFGSSGCTGCGRCITWCPVGIDITEEVAAIQASEEEIE